MSKREIFSMNRVVARNLLSKRFLRYEVTKNHYDALHVRHQILEKGNIFHFKSNFTYPIPLLMLSDNVKDSENIDR